LGKRWLKASIIISNYEGLEFLPKCLNHLVRQTYPNYEIIFIDAGSIDGSADYVEKEFPKIKTIRCGRIGIGEAVNIGVKNASGDIIVFDVNTDEYVEPDWLEELVRQLRRHKYKIIAGPVRIIYGTNLIDEAGVNINLVGRSRKVGHLHPIESFLFGDNPVDFVGAPAFHKKILEEIGLIDETYFIYAEDLDFCYRAKLAGFETHCAPLARSHHHIRGTFGSNYRRLEYYLRRANIRFHCIYSGPLRLILTSLYFCFFLPATALVTAFVPTSNSNMYKEKFIGRLKAVLWNLQNLKKTMRLRRKAKTFKITGSSMVQTRPFKFNRGF